MKKIIAVILSMVMLLSLVACNSGGNGTVEPSGNNGNVNQQENKTQTVKAGDKIVTDSMEIKINSVELTYDVLPDNTSGFYTHYAADAGKVYIAVDASVTNKAKQNLGCDEIGKIVADYNNGYTYRGFIVVKDSSTGFTYAKVFELWRPFGMNVLFCSGAYTLGGFALIGGLAALDFNKAFEIFHKIFFPGKDNWMFSWYEDEIIRILPQDFFMNCAILILCSIILLCLGCIAYGLIGKYREKHLKKI